ncbi:MAG: hypothetical protein NTW50_01310 [Candidatus Berkelbacteria bacterium]|nr:hypothetical protein [Candidatus Berkelbacteria bacterium]
MNANTTLGFTQNGHLTWPINAFWLLGTLALISIASLIFTIILSSKERSKLEEIEYSKCQWSYNLSLFLWKIAESGIIGAVIVYLFFFLTVHDQFKLLICQVGFGLAFFVAGITEFVIWHYQESQPFWPKDSEISLARVIVEVQRNQNQLLVK